LATSVRRRLALMSFAELQRDGSCAAKCIWTDRRRHLFLHRWSYTPLVCHRRQAETNVGRSARSTMPLRAESGRSRRPVFPESASTACRLAFLRRKAPSSGGIRSSSSMKRCEGAHGETDSREHCNATMSTGAVALLLVDCSIRILPFVLFFHAPPSALTCAAQHSAILPAPLSERTMAVLSSSSIRRHSDTGRIQGKHARTHQTREQSTAHDRLCLHRCQQRDSPRACKVPVASPCTQRSRPLVFPFPRPTITIFHVQIRHYGMRKTKSRRIKGYVGGMLG
jgi:hypothetical protein